MSEWQIERIDRDHGRRGFHCGRPSLDHFPETLVNQYEKRNLGRTYVATRGNDRRVLGYYTLASGSVEVESLPTSHARKLPRHAVPVVLLARLAVDRTVQGQGLGGYLLRDGLSRSLDLSDTLGIHAVVVDAIDGAAKVFYERFGFLALTDGVMRLFLPLNTIRSATRP